jgi:hypothetical protein
MWYVEDMPDMVAYFADYQLTNISSGGTFNPYKYICYTSLNSCFKYMCFLQYAAAAAAHLYVDDAVIVKF